MLSKLLPTLRSALVGALQLLAAASMAQTTINVGPAQAYTTIQSGINAANNGDTVLVAPGTYNESINFNGKAITVTSSGGAAKTIIDGGSSPGPAVSFVAGETSAATISGFTIQHGGVLGSGSFNSGIGGIYLENSTPTILNNLITLNQCWDINSNHSAPTIQNNTISATQDPDANCGFGGGAAIIVWNGFSNQSSQIDINAGFIIGNTIENNVESGMEDAGGNGGAGIALWGGNPLIMNNIIRNNSSPGGSGGAINIVYGQNAVIAQNLIYGNSAGCGGGALATNGGGLFVLNNTIVDNVGQVDGGFSECAAIAQIYPNPDSYGYDNPRDIFINNIISGSTSYPAVNCTWFLPPNEAYQPTFQNNILYNAGGPFFGSFCVDVSDKYNNIAADPQFVNSAGGDYRLKSTSPAIDSGQNSVLQTFLTAVGLAWTQDLAGNPRVQSASSKGCIIDIGAYEYPGSVTQCGTSETLTSSLNPAMAGQTVTFRAQLSAATSMPTGSIQFLDGTNLLATQTVSSTGSATYSTNSLTVGSHSITANYQPTGNFSASTASLTQVITGFATNTALACQPDPINIYGTAQLTASVTSANGTPTGSVTFSDNGSPLATNGLVSGATILAYTGSIAETHLITASYIPTGPFAGSSTTCSEVVNALPTISALTVAPKAPTYGAPVTLTATVASTTLPGHGTPTGAVTFLNGASTLGTGTLAAGVATLTPGTLPGGSYSLTCMYGGSSIYASSNCNSVPITIDPAPTKLTLSSSSNPAPFQGVVTLTARLTANGQSAATGNTIHLTVAGQTLSLITDATGSAAYTVPPMLPGSYPVTAGFVPTNSLLASSASLTEVISPVPTAISLTAAPDPGDVNQQVTLQATVVPQITSTLLGGGPLPGAVTFYDGSTALGAFLLSAGNTTSMKATFTVAGTHSLTAVYAGSQDYSGSTSAVVKEAIVAGDFSIQAQPGAATVYTGEAAEAQVSVTSLRGFNQSLALSCSGLPANATCSFTPASLPDGQGAAKIVIRTAAPHQAAASAFGSVSGIGAILGVLTFFLLPGRNRRRFLIRLSATLLAAGIGMASAGCGSPNPIADDTPPGVYQIAVTATTTGAGTPLLHSAIVTLTVKSLF